MGRNYNSKEIKRPTTKDGLVGGDIKKSGKRVGNIQPFCEAKWSDRRVVATIVQAERDWRSPLWQS